MKRLITQAKETTGIQNASSDEPKIRRALLDWFRCDARSLPWRKSADPYAVWVSEVMLQQTQVATVVPYYDRFLQTFPTLADLARSPLERVLEVWSGLGYYRRGRHLHDAAKEIVERFGGVLPRDYQQLRTLPGIGDYTARAILSIAFNQPRTLLDGRGRVIARLMVETSISRAFVRRGEAAGTSAVAPLPRRVQPGANGARADRLFASFSPMCRLPGATLVPRISIWSGRTLSPAASPARSGIPIPGRSDPPAWISGGHGARPGRRLVGRSMEFSLGLWRLTLCGSDQFAPKACRFRVLCSPPEIYCGDRSQDYLPRHSRSCLPCRAFLRNGPSAVPMVFCFHPAAGSHFASRSQDRAPGFRRCEAFLGIGHREAGF